MTVEGRLRHSWRLGRARHPATLDDYANMSRAALALSEATGDKRYLAAAEGWVAILDAQYWDSAGGGYFFTADDTRDVIIRSKTAIDHAVPSGNATMVGVLARLYYLTGKDAYRDRADALVGAFAGEIGRNFFPLASFINAQTFLQKAVQVVIAGEPGAPDTQAMLEALRRRSLARSPAHARRPRREPARGSSRSWQGHGESEERRRPHRHRLCLPGHDLLAPHHRSHRPRSRPRSCLTDQQLRRSAKSASTLPSVPSPCANAMAPSSPSAGASPRRSRRRRCCSPPRRSSTAISSASSSASS